jgi:two-component system nitrate/nitrite response regulator NarL
VTDEPNPTRILLAEDQPLFRTALATLIGGQPDFVVVGQAENGLQALELARELVPDVLLMDVEMPVMDGIAAVHLVKEQVPGVKVVMLTVSESDDHLFDAVRFGADGYLLKDLRPEHLYDMIRAVMRGETPLSPAVAGRLLRDVRERRPVHVAPTVEEQLLTRREVEVLQMVATGLSNKEIGGHLSITEGTVKNHVHNALEKLQLENRIQAAAYVVRQGWAVRPG